MAVLAAFFSSIRFVPLNPALPISRHEKILTSASVDLIVNDTDTKELAASLSVQSIDLGDFLAPLPPEGLPEMQTIPDENAIAYHMFTSGSTGDPKGVPVNYACLEHYITQVTDALGIPSGRRFSQLFDLSFDLAMHDIFLALYSGGTICPARPMDLLMPHSYLAKNKIDIWFSVPMLASQVAKGQGDKPVGHSLEMALFCGEALPSDSASAFQNFLVDGAPLYNLYGPTEATIAFTYKRFSQDDAILANVPLGAPFGSNRIAIETEGGVTTSPKEGDEGELLLAGPQVFEGYQPETGSSPFIESDSDRYYRSGDLVCIREGELVYLGRNDGQIKLRGYRIELGDIEAAFRKVFGCKVAAAVLLGEGDDRQIAIAYEAEKPFSDMESLHDALPKYMHPVRFLCLDAMPTNMNGKIDRKALKAMSWPD